MKNIYDLFNRAEDNDDIISENDRMEMSDMEKRRIYNRILLNAEGEQQDESKQQNRQEQGKKGGKIKKLLTAAACMVVICAVGFTAGADVKEYLYRNTQQDYREKLDSTESEDTEENGIPGVSIQMTEVRMVDNSLTFDCTFTFDGDISEMQSEMEQWAVIEDRNAVYDQLFEHSEFYVDGINLLDEEDDGSEYVISKTDVFVYGEHVSFEDNMMHMMFEFEFSPLEEGKNYTIKFNFKDLNMGDHVLAGSWEYTYEAKSNAYEEELKWYPIEIDGECYDEKWTLNRYAITPNGLKIDATIEETRDYPDFSYEKDGYDVTDMMRILAWDDLGNYYLMYPRSKDYNSDDRRASYHARFNLYDGAAATQEGLKNRDYKLVWDENASTVTFVIEKVMEKWDKNTKLYVGADYEFVSEPYTIKLTKD